MVSIVMGSKSDYSTMNLCEKVLRILKISFETNIVSAHRTPQRMFKYAKFAEKRNISVNQCKSKYIIFLDSDAYPNKNWIESTFKFFKNSS